MHEVMRVTDTADGVTVTCACGKELTAETSGVALAKHEHHFQIERARAALAGTKGDDGGLDQG